MRREAAHFNGGGGGDRRILRGGERRPHHLRHVRVGHRHGNRVRAYHAQYDHARRRSALYHGAADLSPPAFQRLDDSSLG